MCVFTGTRDSLLLRQGEIKASPTLDSRQAQFNISPFDTDDISHAFILFVV